MEVVPMRLLSFRCLIALIVLSPLALAEERPDLGIRLSLSKDKTGVFVSGLAPKAPAWSMGFRVEDKIESVKIGNDEVKIDSVATAEKTLERLVGSHGAEFLITVRRYSVRKGLETVRLTGAVEAPDGHKSFKVKNAKSKPDG
jgi:C-terminal processing protease CtpA/Prc